MRQIISGTVLCGVVGKEVSPQDGETGHLPPVKESMH